MKTAACGGYSGRSVFGPLLRGEKVTLRPARENDAEHFVRWFADMEVTRHLATRMAIILQQELEFLKRIGESKNDVWWVIDVADQAIGATGIHAINWLDANGTTGIVIGEKASWGKGLRDRGDAAPHSLRIPRAQPAQAHDRGGCRERG